MDSLRTTEVTTDDFGNTIPYGQTSVSGGDQSYLVVKKQTVGRFDWGEDTALVEEKLERRGLSYGAVSDSTRMKLTRCTGKEQWKAVKCVEGKMKRIRLRCGFCHGCRNQWKLQVARKMLEGCRLRQGKDAWFATFTLQQSTTNRHSIDAILRAFRNLTKSKWWRNRWRGMEYCRILERHKDGAIHMHCIFFPPRGTTMPTCERAKDRETIRSHYGRQSPEGKEWIQKVVQAGFGPMTHLNRARILKGLAVYCTKYFAKGDRGEWRNRTGGQVRVFDTSKGWLPPTTPSDHIWIEDLHERWRDEAALDRLPEQTECPCESRVPAERAGQVKLAKMAIGLSDIDMADARSEEHRLAAQQAIYKAIDRIRQDDIDERPFELTLTPERQDAVDQLRDKLRALRDRGLKVRLSKKHTHFALSILKCILQIRNHLTDIALGEEPRSVRCHLADPLKDSRGEPSELAIDLAEHAPAETWLDRLQRVWGQSERMQDAVALAGAAGTRGNEGR